MTDFITQSQAAIDIHGPEGRAFTREGDAETFFDTLLDVINPLQHLPVISAIYRDITGDAISAPARLVGGFLFGGPIGAAGAVANIAVKDVTGSDIGKHAMALFSDEGTAPTSQLADESGSASLATKRQPVLVDVGDVNAMTADAVTWNGEWRGASPPSPQQAQLTPADGAAANAVNPRKLAAANITGGPGPLRTVGETPGSDTVTPAAVPVQTAWVTAALAEAEQNHPALGAGRGPAPPQRPVSIAAAMSEALDKYRAMAIARHGESRQTPALSEKDR